MKIRGTLFSFEPLFATQMKPQSVREPLSYQSTHNIKFTFPIFQIQKKIFDAILQIRFCFCTAVKFV